MAHEIEKSQLPEIRQADIKLLSSIWIAMHRATQSIHGHEYAALEKLFEQACRDRKLHVPTTKALFLVLLPTG